MSTNNIAHLSQILCQAEDTLTSFVAEIGTNFDSENMAQITALQNVVSTARKDLEDATEEESRMALELSSETGSTFVNFVGTGKSEDSSVEIPTGTTVSKALSILADMYPQDWGHVRDQTKIRVERWTTNQRIAIHDPAKASLTGDYCRIWVGNKVAGGSL
ncbi:MAG: hypothetical protein CL582_13625 [Alteromonadaceae bacterium]|nr:hypothetical protein [Alteromonadaceae bacterium]